MRLEMRYSHDGDTWRRSWIDHQSDRLATLLAGGVIGCHQLAIEELAMGSITKRDVVIDLLGNLVQFPVPRDMRLLEDNETRLAAVRAALIAGENSGAAEPFDFDAFVAAKKA